MRRIFTIILLLAASRSFSQDSLTVYNYMRSRITMNGTEFLGGWAAANIAVGIGGWASTQSGSQQRYFYQMTTIWNVVNLGAAAYGYYVADNAQNRLTGQASKNAQAKVERTFLINGALDLGYIGIGYLLDHKGNADNSAIKKGYGSAILVQGAFLLIFDTYMLSLQKHNGSKMARFLGKHPIAFDGRRVGIIFHI